MAEKFLRCVSPYAIINSHLIAFNCSRILRISIILWVFIGFSGTTRGTDVSGSVIQDIIS